MALTYSAVTLNQCVPFNFFFIGLNDTQAIYIHHDTFAEEISKLLFSKVKLVT